MKCLISKYKIKSGNNAERFDECFSFLLGITLFKDVFVEKRSSRLFQNLIFLDYQ